MLPSHKCEANAEFEQKFPDVIQQTLFEAAFARIAADCEKIEIARVFERLLGKIGLRRRQGPLKVSDGVAFAFVRLRLNVVREHRA